MLHYSFLLKGGVQGANRAHNRVSNQEGIIERSFPTSRLCCLSVCLSPPLLTRHAWSPLLRGYWKNRAFSASPGLINIPFTSILFRPSKVTFMGDLSSCWCERDWIAGFDHHVISISVWLNTKILTPKSEQKAGPYSSNQNSSLAGK